MSSELLDRLTGYVKGGATSVSTSDSAFIQSCLDEAIALVDNRCGTGKVNVPVPVLQRAYINVGADLYYRKNAPQGVSQFTAIDGAAIRLGKNPMDAAEDLLRPFLAGGFA